MSQFPCAACDDGVYTSHYAPPRACEVCGAIGSVAIDPDAIAKAIVSSAGRNKGRIRLSGSGMDGVFGAKFVWRMARFQAGVDPRMPIMAYDTIGSFGLINDRARAILDALEPMVQQAAATHFPSHQHRGTLAWGRALGM